MNERIYARILLLRTLVIFALSFPLADAFVLNLRRSSISIQRPSARWATTSTKENEGIDRGSSPGDAMSAEKPAQVDINDVSRFRGYLNWIGKNANKKSRWHAALRMDQELLMMEKQFYTNDKQAKRDARYHGDVVRPDPSCYGVVADAYAIAYMGKEGAQRATALLERCQACIGQNVGLALHTGVMKAWAISGDFEKARKMLSDLEARYEATGDAGLAPDMIIYTVYLNVLAKSKKTGDEIRTEAMDVMQQMNEKSVSGENVKVQPNAVTYSAVMRCLARAQDYEGIETLFKELKTRYESAPKESKANFRIGKLTYGTLIGIYMESDLGDKAAERAHELLDELRAQYKGTKDIAYQPNPYIYSSVLVSYSKATSKSQLKRGLSRTNQILDECRQDKFLSQDTRIIDAAMKMRAHRHLPKGAEAAERLMRNVPKPSIEMYQTAIGAYAARNQVHQAQRLLEELTAVGRERRLKNCPNTVTLVACLRAWTRLGGSKAVQHADGLIRRVIQLQVKYPKTFDRRIFWEHIMAWRRTGKVHAGERAEQILNLLDDAYEQTKNRLLAPANFTYQAVIEAWGNSSHPDAGQRALALAGRMETELNVVASNTVLYPVMKTLVRGGNTTMITAANDVYSRMCTNYLAGDQSYDLTPKTNTMLLRYLSANPDESAGMRAENLLRHMESMSAKPGLEILKPCEFEYNCVVNAYSKKLQVEDAERIAREMEDRSDLTALASTYNVIVCGLIERGLAGDEKRADDILKTILTANEAGQTETKLDAVFFSSLLFSLSTNKRNDSALASRGFEVVEQARASGFIPGDMDYGILCKLVLKNGTLDHVRKLIEVIKQVESNYDAGLEAELGKDVYTQALLACMMHNDPKAKQVGEDFLTRLEGRAASGKSKMRLDRQIYHVPLSSWAQSDDEAAFQETMAMFARMKKLPLRESQPAIRTFNWILFAAGRTKCKSEQDARQRFEVALELFTEVHESQSIRPTPLTYSNFLFVCTTLLPTGQGSEKIARNVVNLCRRKGMFSDLVSRAVERFFPTVWQELKAEHDLKDGAIPESWQRRAVNWRKTSADERQEQYAYYSKITRR